MKNRELDQLRFDATEVENHYIDEYMAGRISRQRLLQLGTGIGMSLPLLGMFGTASALASSSGGSSAKAGGTLRVGSLKAAIAIDPVTSATQATLAATSITGEYLVYVSPATGQLKPEIATAWKTPDGKGKSWVFTIRQGVKFHDGTPLTADDVVSTFQRLSDPANNSSALSVLKGLLSRAGSPRPGPFEVTMTPVTAEPVAAVPDRLADVPGRHPAVQLRDRLVREDVPGHRPVQAHGLHPGVSATFVRNTAYWGGTPAARRRQPDVLRGHRIADPGAAGRRARPDPAVRVPGGSGAHQEQAVQIFSTKSSVHRELPMRVDVPPFNDKNVRLALALVAQPPVDHQDAVRRPGRARQRLADRPVAGGVPEVGSPAQAEPGARRRRSPAGKKVKTQLTTQNAYELPDLAVLVQNAAKAIGFTI